jgi:hypothetical protein
VKTIKRHLSASNVIACIALFVALGSTAVAATKLGTGQVKAKNIAKQAVTNAKIKTEAVTSGKIKNGSVVNADLGAGAVNAEKIATGAVIAKKIGKKAVTNRTLADEAVTVGKLGKESVDASKIQASLYGQLVRNVSYYNAGSGKNAEGTKSATANCPTGKEAIGGGVRLEGSELGSVAVTASVPVASGNSRTGWQASAHETGAGPFDDWEISAFVVCAEL